MMGMLDYKHLEALALVVREGGFERAAKSLNLTQSAVSQRIKQLEEQTGQVLLSRVSPPVPTPPGRRMIKHYLLVKGLEQDLSDLFEPEAESGSASLPIGVNQDSLATWLLPALSPYLTQTRILLDIRTDDQERTQRMLKNGEVAGCISTLDRPMQGCLMRPLGEMTYRLAASPDFAASWFPKGITREAVEKTPGVVFDRKDDLHDKLLRRIFEHTPLNLPLFYLPSSERFIELVLSGLAYGAVPDLQSRPFFDCGRLIELSPLARIKVRLYWHCWNIQSRPLKELTRALLAGAGKFLEQ